MHTLCAASSDPRSHHDGCIAAGGQEIQAALSGHTGWTEQAGSGPLARLHVTSTWVGEGGVESGVAARPMNLWL